MRIVALVRERVTRGVAQRERDAPLVQQLLQRFRVQLDDVADLLAGELLEHHDLVEAVQELGPEVLAE